jgi:hypothetical protein
MAFYGVKPQKKHQYYVVNVGSNKYYFKTKREAEKFQRSNAILWDFKGEID